MSPRPGYAPRRPASRAVPVPELIAMLVTAERFARAACDLPGEVQHVPGDLLDLRMRLRDVTVDAFPGASEVARLAFGAFLNSARAFVHPAASPEARTACAPMLREAARLTDHFLTLHRTAQAEPWRRQFGDD